MFVVLKPFGDDYQKKYFVLAIATSIINTFKHLLFIAKG